MNVPPNQDVLDRAAMYEALAWKRTQVLISALAAAAASVGCALMVIQGPRAANIVVTCMSFTVFLVTLWSLLRKR